VNATDPVTLARAVLAAEKRHDGTPAHEAELREERWEFYEDLCTSGAPTLAYAVIGLTDKVERMKTLAADLDFASLWVINHPDVDNDLKAHAHADRDLAARIRAVLNGETND